MQGNWRGNSLFVHMSILKSRSKQKVQTWVAVHVSVFISLTLMSLDDASRVGYTEEMYDISVTLLTRVR